MYKEARFQIIGKVPFRDARGAIEKAQLEEDPNYLNHLTSQDLIQLYGRTNRAPDDFSITWVIDDNIEPFLNRFEHFFTGYFLEAFQRIESVNDVEIPSQFMEAGIG